ncbi:ATP-binding protein [Leptospira ellisii]|uniref:histidine kinase n=1 Tax=Leptospira ellisii TaxID=2023197 RepID=A0A2N0BNG5_9LEPT|nr:ATP-binding protein [Leptospira ellisii]MDV6236615.1 ATP-binding protein [Leptospira ellisii]PJZ93855.1 hypothetical protein CH379_05585 [Leptospira ellisii]PKA05513.1 hypothetical protein CH375_04705 [Leptospira ellisii]
MQSAVQWFELLFRSIPLPLLEVWGRFGFIIGLVLMIAAFGGFTFLPGGRWGLGRERQAWDAQALMSVPFTFVLIFITGYLGSFVVLVPGAQTFESLKDLSVFLCIVLFGYPALIAVPFAYGLSDLIEGVPPSFLSDWILGYFINPACFWVAYQLIGRDPDFGKIKTWFRYLVFVSVFMTIEPQLWGFICSDKFTPSISYRNITPALFFTTALTWLMAPLAMSIAYPVAKKYGMFWADIPGHVKEFYLSYRERVWNGTSAEERDPHGLPIRMFLVTPFILLVLVMVGVTAYLNLQSSEHAADKLAARLHQEISENINLRLDLYLEKNPNLDEASRFRGMVPLLASLGIAEHGRATIIDRSGNQIASSKSTATSTNESDAKEDSVTEHAVRNLRETLGDLRSLRTAVQFDFDIVTEKPLFRETWLTQATPYQDNSGRIDWIVITAIPASYYLEGVRTGSSRSAMVFAVALTLSLLIAAFLAGIVTAPIRRISDASSEMARGDLAQRVPGSRLEELGILSSSFNHMAEQLQESFRRTKSSEEQFRDLVDTTPGIVWEADASNFDFTFVSQQVVDVLGYSVEEWKSPGFWASHLHPDDREWAVEFCIACTGRMEAHDFEYRFIRKDGSAVWLRDLVKVIVQNGKPKWLRGVMVDVTEKKQIEATILDLNANLERKIDQRTEELRKSNSDLQEAVHNLETIMKELQDAQNQLLLSEKLAALGQLAAGMTHELNTPLGAIVSSNRAILEILSNEMKSIPDLILGFNSEETESFRILLEESLNDASQSEIIPNRSLKKELLVSFQEYGFENYEDVTSAVLDSGVYRLGDRLRELLRSKRRMDILNVVLSFSTIVRLSNVISIASGKASHVVDALKNYLNPGVQESDDIIVPVDVRAEIETILTLYHTKIKYGVEIVTDYKTDELCLGNGNKLNQVWINLLNNALQSMNYQGRIEIGLEKRDSWIITSFTDSGAGIPEEVKDKIFQPFFTTKKQGEGIGLGLDICKNIIEKMGGRIEFESVPGRTRFSVWLKAADRDNEEVI